MPEKFKPSEFIFRHPNPGYRVTLFNEDGSEFAAKNGKHTALFRDTGAGNDRMGVFRTSDEAFANAVMRTDAFQKGVIKRMQTEEEVKFYLKRTEQLKTLENFKALVEKGLFDVEALDQKKEKDVHQFAREIGIETADEGGKRLKADILLDIKLALGIVKPEPEFEDEEFEDEPDPEPEPVKPKPGRKSEAKTKEKKANEEDS